MPKRSYRRWEPDEIDALVTMVHQRVPRAEIARRLGVSELRVRNKVQDLTAAGELKPEAMAAREDELDKLCAHLRELCAEIKRRCSDAQ